jgi:hypothetical protein
MRLICQSDPRIPDSHHYNGLRRFPHKTMDSGFCNSFQSPIWRRPLGTSLPDGLQALTLSQNMSHRISSLRAAWQSRPATFCGIQVANCPRTFHRRVYLSNGVRSPAGWRRAHGDRSRDKQERDVVFPSRAYRIGAFMLLRCRSRGDSTIRYERSAALRQQARADA